ncbi:unnamed protein product, partial [Iphiclides podalirius]
MCKLTARRFTFRPPFVCIDRAWNREVLGINLKTEVNNPLCIQYEVAAAAKIPSLRAQGRPECIFDRDASD